MMYQLARLSMDQPGRGVYAASPFDISSALKKSLTAG